MAQAWGIFTPTELWLFCWSHCILPSSFRLLPHSRPGVCRQSDFSRDVETQSHWVSVWILLQILLLQEPCLRDGWGVGIRVNPGEKGRRWAMMGGGSLMCFFSVWSSDGCDPLTSLGCPPMSSKHILPWTPLVSGSEPEATGFWFLGPLILSWEV